MGGAGSHIAIDAVGAKHSGAARIAVDCMRAACLEEGVRHVTVFASPERERRFPLEKSSKLEVIEVGADGGGLQRLHWSLVELPERLTRLGADSILLLGGSGLGNAQTRSFVFVQQSLPFSSEAKRAYGLLGRVKIAAIDATMRVACSNGSGVFVQTETMRQAVRRRYGISAAQIFIVPPRIVPRFHRSETEVSVSDEESAQLLYIGNASPYKNLGLLKEGMAALRRALPEARLGVSFKRRDFELGEGVEYLGFLDDAGLARAYGGAAVLVMPSFVETVGLPMIEAMGYGVPVLAADRPYAHEVCGEAARYFDPASPEDFASKAAKLLSDGDARRAVGARAREIAGRYTRDSYREMVARMLRW